MPYASNKPTRTDGGRLARRFADERWRWYYAAQNAKRPGRNVTGMPVPHPMTRPYLLAHPEREIAAAGTHIGVAYCAACRITYKAMTSISALPGPRIAAAYRFINEHNALIHPRRAARLTQ